MLGSAGTSLLLVLSSLLTCGGSIYRFALASCYHQHDAALDRVWSVVNSYAPDHLALLGDQIYVDKVAITPESVPQVIRDEYAKLSNGSHFKELLHSLPDGWSATLDDHDYGEDAADKNYKHRNTSQVSDGEV
jgi:hypothetical protein